MQNPFADANAEEFEIILAEESVPPDFHGQLRPPPHYPISKGGMDAVSMPCRNQWFLLQATINFPYRRERSS